MEAWAAGLLGALVGAASSFAGIWIQSHYQNRREVAKMVIDAASKDRAEQIELGIKLNKGGAVAPIALFVHYHAELFRLVGQGKLTKESLRRLYADNKEMSRLIRQMHDEGLS